MQAEEPFRIAFFNTELSRKGPGLLLRDIERGEDEQVAAVADVILEVSPDILVLASIDYDHDLRALGALNATLESAAYPHLFALRPNTGLQTGEDIDGDGRLGGPGDAHGFGHFSGQGGLAVLSRFPIDKTAAIDHSALNWLDLTLPLGPPQGTPEALRLSTTAHWEIPVTLPSGERIDLFTWHATPPVFDGPEDRNGRRNHDEAAFWIGRVEAAEHPAILLGDANADPLDGDGRREAINALLNHPALQDPRPASTGGPLDAVEDGGVNLAHKGDPALDTADWSDTPGGPGNLRVSYVLPSAGFTILDAGVFWPAPEDDARALIGPDGNRASRHRLVWVDLMLDGAR